MEILNSRSSMRILRYLRCAGLFVCNPSEVVILGSRGDYFGQPLTLLKPAMGKRLVVFDGLLSLYETLVVDRNYYPRDSCISKVLHMLDRAAFQFSDVVISDSDAHARYYSKEFDVPISKIRTLYIGTDDSVFYPREKGSGSPNLIVGFWGGFIPLQGIETIVEAARLLSSEKGVEFRLHGQGQTLEMIRSLCKKMEVSNLHVVDRWRPYESLPDLIREFDVCLGIFGQGSKAQNVIPNKVYEALAMKKPVITADTCAARELLTNGKDSLLSVPGDAASLAECILDIKNSPNLRERIAVGGYDLFKSRLSPLETGRTLVSILNEFAK